MEVTNDNKPGEKPAINPNTEIVPDNKASSGTNTGASQPSNPPGQPFPPPKVMEAIIDPKLKPKETGVPFSFNSPQAMHAKAAQPTKGDVAKAEEVSAKPKMTLAELDAEIAADEKGEKPHTYDDYRETAEMFVEGWEAFFTFIGRRISKDNTDSAYEFSKEKRERLIHQATKVSRKRNWVMPIEYLFVGTLLPATGSILLKADDKRREYNKKNEEAIATGSQQEINKGGPNKGLPKRRGPGRPSK